MIYFSILNIICIELLIMAKNLWNGKFKQNYSNSFIFAKYYLKFVCKELYYNDKNEEKKFVVNFVSEYYMILIQVTIMWSSGLSSFLVLENSGVAWK